MDADRAEAVRRAHKLKLAERAAVETKARERAAALDAALETERQAAKEWKAAAWDRAAAEASRLRETMGALGTSIRIEPLAADSA
eukprot:954094-Prymnesium_polylepis.1